MQKIVNLVLLSALCCSCTFASDGLVAWWNFDAESGPAAVDSVSGAEDKIIGYYKYVPGVKGKSLKTDGYTTSVNRDAGRAPELVDGFTFEAWIAPQAYSWNHAAVISEGAEPGAKKSAGASEVTEEQLEAGLFGAKFSDGHLREADGLDTLKHVNQDWSGGSKDWSARWRGYIKAPHTGEVTFHAEADNGLKLEIDNQMVIDGWGPGKSRSGKISMVKGKLYPIILAYSQDGGKSILRLYWSWARKEKALIKASSLGHTTKDKRTARKDSGFKEEEANMEQRLLFGIDAEGRLVLQALVNWKLQKCVSDAKLDFLKWSHIAGTFDKASGLKVYINGRQAGSLAVTGQVTPAKGKGMLIGKNHKNMSPVNSERGPSRKLKSTMVFDGLIDEVKIYNRALSAAEVKKAYAAVKPAEPKPLAWRQMPSGPKDLPNRFAASYCRLRYSEEWEQKWRVGEHSDILVRFDKSPVRLLFWRGTAYGAVWVAENGKWMGDQSLERTGNSTGWGCAEHMSDKQNRHSYVRIIENHDARKVVHWRYAISDIVYNIYGTDIDGWGEWADEYYYIYPDAVSTRQQILWSNDYHHEWQETIVLHQPGTRPEDNIEINALTWANMDGESVTFSWENRPGGRKKKPADPTIQITNLKSENRPFIIYEPDNGLKIFGCCVEKDRSHFAWWNHWPVAQLPNDGRRASAHDRPAHSSLSQGIEDSPSIKHEPGKGKHTAVTLTGMTAESSHGLVPLARSWNRPAELKLSGEVYESGGYDKYQRAYVLVCLDAGNPSRLQFEIEASEKSPLVNLAFVVENWGEGEAKLKINGETVKRGDNFRLGHNHRIDGSDLIVWVQTESTKPVKISLSPAGG